MLLLRAVLYPELAWYPLLACAPPCTPMPVPECGGPPPPPNPPPAAHPPPTPPTMPVWSLLVDGLHRLLAFAVAVMVVLRVPSPERLARLRLQSLLPWNGAPLPRSWDDACDDCNEK